MENLTFIDLFAGIGGFHLAFSRLTAKCVFASEIDKHAREVYIKNHNFDENIFNDDIRSIAPSLIPDHDILCAGFPCQPFSQAGHKRGFDDVHNSERGNLFYNIADILEEKRPKAFILENVRHLLNHDNGKTFQTIKNILEKELNYTIYYKIIKASDFGRPQHRPRIYIVGFNNSKINTLFNFEFPEPIGTKMTMSDVWEGNCNREIGYTLRVGGKGSPITDRRNWDGYIVDGNEVRISPKEGKRMMGYPDDFQLSKSKIQAMKQLGNSVCVDVVYHIGIKVIEYIKKYQYSQEEIDLHNNTFNKGEWSELYAFLKIINDKKIKFGDKNLNIIDNDEYISVFQISHNNNNYIYKISKGTLFIICDGKIIDEYKIQDILKNDFIIEFKNKIINNKNTFSINEKDILDMLHVDKFKGSSLEKGDLVLSFDHKNDKYLDQNFGLKSYLGANPTLLNASSNTNFIYLVEGFDGNIDDVNKIATKSKIKDRINYIKSKGGVFQFERCEKPIFEKNLRIVDGDMINIISAALLNFYSGNGSKISDLFCCPIEIIKVKRLLEIITLGLFPGTEWDGEYTAQGLILISKIGDLLAYHVIKRKELNEYLFYNTKLDTPSTTRHKFGSLIDEKGKKYFKLNLQIRCI